MVRVMACWGALMVLFMGELAIATTGFGSGICAVAVLMGLVIVFGFMRITLAPPLAAIFALGSLFWLAILLSLGSLDSFTRTNFSVGDTLSSRTQNAVTARDRAP